MPEERQRGGLIQHPSCPYCKDAVRPEDEKAACHGCMAWHHSDCWTAHGTCSACGAVRGDQDVSPAQQATPVAPVCAWRDCSRLARPSPGARERDLALVQGERLHVDRLCPLHKEDGLSKKRTEHQLVLILFSLMAVGSPFLGWQISVRDRYTSLEEGLLMGFGLAVLGLGLATWAFMERARLKRLMSRTKDP